MTTRRQKGHENDVHSHIKMGTSRHFHVIFDVGVFLFESTALPLLTHNAFLPNALNHL
jgi:hypothetical protein